jgi:hypothetical protein
VTVRWAGSAVHAVRNSWATRYAECGAPIGPRAVYDVAPSVAVTCRWCRGRELMATAKTELWAVYVATPSYGVQGITLHANERAAWRAVISYLGVPAGESEPGAAADVVELATWVEEHADDAGMDYHVARVQLPGATVQPGLRGQ